jgi:beta-glucosidase/6-phospho-beta-glucosidase/beta-galactosidase
VPWGFYNVLQWIHTRYSISSESVLPWIYITENGCDAPNESQLSLNDALKDDFR